MAAKCKGDLLSGLVEILNVTYFWHNKWYEQRGARVAGADRCCQMWKTGSSLQPLLPTLTAYLDLTPNPGRICLAVPTQIPTFTKHSCHPSSNLRFSYLALLVVVLQNTLLVGQAVGSTLVHWHFMSFPCLPGEKVHAQDWHAAAESGLHSTNATYRYPSLLYPRDWCYGLEANKNMCYSFLSVPFHNHFREILI